MRLGSHGGAPQRKPNLLTGQGRRRAQVVMSMARWPWFAEGPDVAREPLGAIAEVNTRPSRS
jgi:hypothetical protein